MQYICVSAAGTLFSLDVHPVTNVEALDAEVKTRGFDKASPELVLRALAEPQGTDKHATFGKAQELANGCMVYASGSLAAERALAGA